jgi:hypothetical protein
LERSLGKGEIGWKLRLSKRGAREGKACRGEGQGR